MNIIYLFEDDKDDKLSKIFRSGFSTDVQSRFEYSYGNLSLCKKAKAIIDNTDVDILVIFVDVVPNNVGTAEIFCRLCELAEDTLDKTVLVVPTLGSEYYFLKSIHEHKLYKDTYIMEIYYDVKSYINDKRCKEYFDRMNVKESSYSTFERFGKKLISTNFGQCISKPNRYRDYYTQDCRCSDPKECTHIEYTLQNKVKKIIKQYSLLPVGNTVYKVGECQSVAQYMDEVSKFIMWIIDRAENEFKLDTAQLDVYKSMIDGLDQLRRRLDA